MTIKELRKITGLSQREFGEFYDIPVSTIKKWESDPNNPNYHKCPIYTVKLLERVIKIDFKDKKC